LPLTFKNTKKSEELRLISGVLKKYWERNFKNIDYGFLEE
jgi:hypothetical protein